MRVYCVAFLMGVTAATGASASSFVTVDTPSAASAGSFVYFGMPAPVPAVATASLAADLPALNYPVPLPAPLATAAPSLPAVQLSPSIVAMGEPAVENFQVAAIAGKKPASRRPDLAPMVIRGGISGEMFARETPPAIPDSSSEAEPEQTSAGASQPAKPEPRRTPEPQLPAPAPAPPSSMGPLRGQL